MEQTLSIIKPDAVEKKQIGNILARFEQEGLKIAGLRMVHLTQDEAKKFYAVHIERPFYDALTRFMSSGPIVVAILEGENAIERNRKIMGNTDSKKAERGTLRNLYGTDVEKNAVHGSDAPETAKTEIAFFFPKK